MATASPTPVGQGSHFTSLGRRTSARQALRRPPSRSQLAAAAGAAATAPAGSKRSSTAALLAAHDQQQQQQPYLAMHDSSDDEMPIPMKLSALTKALLSDGAAASDEAAVVTASAVPAPVSSASQRPLHARSASALAGSGRRESRDSNFGDQAAAPVVRQTRRSVRAGSAQARISAGSTSAAAAAAVAGPASASRAASPPMMGRGGVNNNNNNGNGNGQQDSSPVPRKRVVRLSAATPANGLAQQPPPPPLRRSLSASKHASRRGAASSASTAAAAAAAPISMVATAATPAAPADKVEDNLASSGLRSSLRSSQSTDASRPTAASTAETTPAEAAPVSSFSSSAGLGAGVVNTPAGGIRKVQINVGSSASRSAARARLSASSSSALLSSRRGDGHYSDSEPAALAVASVGVEEAPGTAGRGSASRYGDSAPRGEAAASSFADQQQQQQSAMPSSIRVKRVGKMLGGGFLSGPARRGRRRTSDEEDGGEGDHSPEDVHPSSAGVAEAQSFSGIEPAVCEQQQQQPPLPPLRDYGAAAATGSPVSAKNTVLQRGGSLRGHSPQAEPLVDGAPAAAPAAPAAAPAPSLRPELPSWHDQENETPLHVRLPKPLMVAASASATAGRDAEKDRLHLGRGLRPTEKNAAEAKPAQRVSVSCVAAAAPTAPAQSPERKVLASISRNTPHRLAPPPPKMTVVETATAATAQANKKPRILLKVNGRAYQRVDCIGRGGSAKVYKVTAENGKMFAMKRVSLENADETTIRGCLGEIDLLRKLSGVDRVIQVFDYEMNKEKQMLSLLMELGEMDLNSLLRVRQNPESAKLDPVFVRFYWKEMLEGLQAVHAHDIVHSDLKPANFVLVQGRLKLIDFGIANAIQTDQTVNVHRETQIGTPNYMSPESLMDSQQYAFTAGSGGLGASGYRGAGAPKLMKLGKPSDVWSLGCILYQMVYGVPPFGHIQNQMARCQAIITWSHAIDFPARGLGGVPVPPPLLATMRRCLNREQHLRPTCEELLSPSDAFLYPENTASAALADTGGLPVSEELLGRIIQSVVSRCRERMPTEGEAMTAWPAAYWASVRRAIAQAER